MDIATHTDTYVRRSARDSQASCLLASTRLNDDMPQGKDEIVRSTSNAHDFPIATKAILVTTSVVPIGRTTLHLPTTCVPTLAQRGGLDRKGGQGEGEMIVGQNSRARMALEGVVPSGIVGAKGATSGGRITRAHLVPPIAPTDDGGNTQDEHRNHNRYFHQSLHSIPSISHTIPFGVIRTTNVAIIFEQHTSNCRNIYPKD